jgi:2-(1,2-epoxy-1,2-dihydrophenyl)acetyl-CoA isomerase
MTAVSCLRDGQVAEIVLTRPDKRNALRDQDVAALRSAVRSCASGPEPARAVLIRGEGPAFCAGRDLTGAEPGTEDGGAILREIFNPLIADVAGLDMPTIAAVNGAAVGAGLGLALACDLVVAGKSARFGSPFGRIGAVTDSGAHRFLLDRIGPARTLELVYTGRMLSGQEAADAGLVSMCVPDGELAIRARQLAASIGSGPTAAFKLSKRLLRQARDRTFPLSEVLEAEACAQTEACRTSDYQAGIHAFLEKRPVSFTGR